MGHNHCRRGGGDPQPGLRFRPAQWVWFNLDRAGLVARTVGAYRPSASDNAALVGAESQPTLAFRKTPSRGIQLADESEFGAWSSVRSSSTWYT
jgi:hypothetical protein